ncbi:MAG TPA: VWA domain-containing protein [Phycisphaerales bacterium]|nr:VWA domain-containing protein [Phycisphaerales bacterium]
MKACIAALIIAATGLGLTAPATRAQVTSTTTTTTTTTVTGPVLVLPQVDLSHRRRPNHLPPRPVEVSAVNVAIAIDEQVAASTLELTLTNRGGRQEEAVILLPVPEGVTVRSLNYDGVGPEPTARVLPRDEARSIYDAIVRSMKDPALVEFAGYNLIRTSAFPIAPGKSQKLSLTYEQVLPLDGDRVDYALPRSEALAGGGAWTITADIRSKRAITGIYSPSHETTIKRHIDNHATVTITQKAADAPGAVRLSYLLQKGDGLSVSTLAYPDATIADGKGGFFMLLGGLPPHSRFDSPKVKREVVLVLDRSGSMKGDKFKQAIAAANQIVDGLEDGESFNIIDYSDSVASFAEKPVAKDKKTTADAKAYLASLQANGGTNINDALLEALRPEPAAGALPMVIFLTDGLPTVGERSEVKIRDAVSKANKAERRIFSFGVGFDVNTPLLAAVSKASRGAPTYVLPDEDVEVKVSQVFRRLAGPILASPKLTVRSRDGEPTTRAIRELFPAELPDLFEGDQIVLAGQYLTDKPVTLRLEGNYLGKPQHFDFELDTTKATTKNSYVPRIWANRKVGALIEAARLASAEGNTNPGAMKEIVDEIVALSTKYGILTEYTSFLATEPNVPMSPSAMPALSTRAADAMRDRMPARSGAASVNQELNVTKQAAEPAPAGNYRYYAADAAGNVQLQEVATVQNVADRTFFQRDNRWVDSQVLQSESQKPDRTIEFGSDEYLALMNDLARDNRQSVLALGGEVLLQVGKERVLVKAP